MQELSNELPTSPLIFFKPDTSVLRNNKDFIIQNSQTISTLVRNGPHQPRGKYIQEQHARGYIDGWE